LWGNFLGKPGGRRLCTLPFSVNAMVILTGVAFAGGGAVVFDTRGSTAEVLAANRVTMAPLMPMVIRDLLDHLPGNFTPLPDLMILGIAGRVPPETRRRLLERVAGRVVEFYASNEMGWVSKIEHDGPEAIGEIMPEVEVRITDEQGRDLPHGQVGAIRVRSD